MYLYWIFITKAPVDKVISLSKYLSQINGFSGMQLRDDNFPRRQATIYFRIKKDEDEDVDDFFSRIFFGLPPLPLFNKITLYHTPENKDTWKSAHRLKEISKTKTSFFALYRNGVLILGKDSVGEYLLELLMIKKFLVKKGYKKATLLKPIKDLPNQSLEQKVKFWGLLTKFTIIVDRGPAYA